MSDVSGPLANNASLKASAPEWTGAQGFEYQDFVPQAFDQSQILEHNEGQSSTGGLLNPYDYGIQGQVQGLQTPQQTAITNPYLQDPSGLAGATYFQNPGFTQPVQFQQSLLQY
jgi:hypothetical protein